MEKKKKNRFCVCVVHRKGSESCCVYCVCSRQEVCLPERQHRPRSQGRGHGESCAPGLLRVHVPAAVAVRAAQGVPQPLPAHGRASGMVGCEAVGAQMSQVRGHCGVCFLPNLNFALYETLFTTASQLVVSGPTFFFHYQIYSRKIKMPAHFLTCLVKN